MFNLFESNTQDYQHLLDSMGKDVTVNESPIKVIITNTNVNKNYDDRYISSLLPLNRGDIVDYDGKKFMIISEESGKRSNRWKGLMRLLPYSITFNSSCVFFRVPAYIETQSFGVQNGQLMTIADGQIYVNVPANEDTKKIKLQDRFIKQNQAFKVVGIDSYSNPGMSVLTCDKDSIVPASDDVVNEIAGGLGCTITITNAEPIQIYETSSLQLTWTATSNFPVVFSSSNPSVASVDANGLIQGVSLGTVTITVANASNQIIKDTVNVTIVEISNTYSVSISGSAELYTGASMPETYTAQVNYGATLITDGSQPVTWSLWDDTKTTTTTYATIKSQTGTNCVVEGVNAGYYVQLKATLNSDPTIVTWFRIRVRSVL